MVVWWHNLRYMGSFWIITIVVICIISVSIPLKRREMFPPSNNTRWKVQGFEIVQDVWWEGDDVFLPCKTIAHERGNVVQPLSTEADTFSQCRALLNECMITERCIFFQQTSGVFTAFPGCQPQNCTMVSVPLVPTESDLDPNARPFSPHEA